jgi:CheY-like chemotaxis protein
MAAGSPAVLVVLSSDEEREAVLASLTAWGFRVLGVPSGRAALTELLRAGVEGNPFALVLIAEHLPDLSAREVLRRLRGRLDTAPPAILLGHSEQDLPAPAGFSVVLARPAVPAELRQAVRQALSHEGSRVSELT